MPSSPRPPVLALCLALACDTAPQASFAVDPPRPSVPTPSASPTALHPLAMMSLLAFAPPPPPPQPPRRHIAVVDPNLTDCPTPMDAANWKVERLFDPNANKLAAFRQFCLYTTAGQLPLASADFAIPAQIVRVDRDLDVLLPMGPPSVPRHSISRSQPLLKELASAYRSNLLAAEIAGVETIYHQAPATTAMVAVVDTMDRTLGAYALADDKRRQWHGITMAELIGDIRCPKGLTACRERTYFANAFTNSDDMNTSLGSPGTLAVALNQAMKNGPPPGPKTPPLVLNLSLGWDSQYGKLSNPFDPDKVFDGLDGVTPAPVQAVYTALAHAACHDALIIAAAGNNTGAPCEQKGAMAPALWETQPAPSRQQCSDWFTIKVGNHRHEGPSPPDTASPGPLIYAAGGVQDDDRPIPNARLGSTPRRVLPAMHAVASERLLTDAWTGTSIAAAGLSSIAANVWSYALTRSPHQIMALLDESGRDLKRPSELTQGTVRRIYAHRAFDRLRSSLTPPPTNPYRETATPTATPTNPGVKPTSTLDALIAQLPTMERTPHDFTCKPNPGCGPNAPKHWRCGPPLLSRPAAPHPSLRPQPDAPICSICPIKGGKLVLSLNPKANITTADLTAVFLDLHGTDSISIPLGPMTVPPNDILVELPYKVQTGKGSVALDEVLSNHRSGTLSFTYKQTDGRSVSLTSAITVEP